MSKSGFELGFGVWRNERVEPWSGVWVWSWKKGTGQTLVRQFRRKNLAEPWFGIWVRRKEQAEPCFRKVRSSKKGTCRTLVQQVRNSKKNLVRVRAQPVLTPNLREFRECLSLNSEPAKPGFSLVLSPNSEPVEPRFDPDQSSALCFLQTYQGSEFEERKWPSS